MSNSRYLVMFGLDLRTETTRRPLSSSRTKRPCTQPPARRISEFGLARSIRKRSSWPAGCRRASSSNSGNGLAPFVSKDTYDKLLPAAWRSRKTRPVLRPAATPSHAPKAAGPVDGHQGSAASSWSTTLSPARTAAGGNVRWSRSRATITSWSCAGRSIQSCLLFPRRSAQPSPSCPRKRLNCQARRFEASISSQPNRWLKRWRPFFSWRSTD